MGEGQLYLRFGSTLFAGDIVGKVFSGNFPEQNRKLKKTRKVVLLKCKYSLIIITGNTC